MPQATAFLPHNRHAEIVAAIIAIGVELRRSCIRGLTFHHTFQKRRTRLSMEFGAAGCRTIGAGEFF